jgi:glutamate synthase (NADPH/NADH) small chain
MKLDKAAVERRVAQMRDEGVEFAVNADVGDGSGGSRDVRVLAREFDAVLLATGATRPRDLPIPGRELSGIHYAMEFLTENTRALLESRDAALSAKGRRVIVIGGGDTGTDCIGTSLRHGCRSLVNFEIFPPSPAARAASNPWPKWPLVMRVDYGHEEAAARFGADPRVYSISSKEFIGDDAGHVRGIRTVDVAFRDGAFHELPGSERVWEADLVLLSMGFLGPEHYVSDPLGIDYDRRSNYLADYGRYATTLPNVFAAGDCRRGQSLVVRAIHEGREAARAIDAFLGR